MRKINNSVFLTLLLSLLSLSLSPLPHLSLCLSLSVACFVYALDKHHLIQLLCVYRKTYTVMKEIFGVRIFLWGRPTTKTKCRNIYLSEHFVRLMFVGCHVPPKIFNPKILQTKKFNTKISQITIATNYCIVLACKDVSCSWLFKPMSVSTIGIAHYDLHALKRTRIA